MIVRRILVAACLGLIALAAIPATSAQEEPKHDPQELAANVKQLFRKQCLDCHDDFLDMKVLVDENKLVIPGDANKSKLFNRITAEDENVRMPQPPQETLQPTEIELIRRWIEAGAPEFPVDVTLPVEEETDPALAGVVGAEYVLKQILEYVEQTPRDDRQYLSFFSSNHLVTDGVTRDVLQKHRQALANSAAQLAKT